MSVFENTKTEFIKTNFTMQKTSMEGNNYGYEYIQVLGIGVSTTDESNHSGQSFPSHIESFLCCDATPGTSNTGHVFICQGDELVMLGECYQRIYKLEE